MDGGIFRFGESVPPTLPYATKTRRPKRPPPAHDSLPNLPPIDLPYASSPPSFDWKASGSSFLPSHPNPLPYKKTRFWEIPVSASRLLQSDKKERLIPLRSTETKSSNPTNKVSLNWFRVFLFGSAVI
ncbi:unnamed protein product [Musa acuminata var. zebrina]